MLMSMHLSSSNVEDGSFSGRVTGDVNGSGETIVNSSSGSPANGVWTLVPSGGGEKRVVVKHQFAVVQE